ncbi:MAG: hypothetical protein LBP58_03175 [Azoarcus sp.]|jgi:hypothetical protein|nr:hypothetical protein [Azoarcus sp.]
MTGKHYNWHKRWTFDPDLSRATHDSGFVVQYLLLPLSEEEKTACDVEGISAVGKCWTDDRREFGIVSTRQVLLETFESFKTEHGTENARAMIARLGREAGEFFVREMRRKN